MASHPYEKILSQNLKSIRKSKGLTTVDLAKILGVSQAKISYIENCKGVLSGGNIAILSKRLNVPITDFFRGLSEEEETSGVKELIGHLVRFGAVLLSKPAGIVLKAISFEEVFAQSLGFIGDDRLHKGFCTALIFQAAHTEINVDRIFAMIGNNPFLIKKVVDQSTLCIRVIAQLEGRNEKYHFTRAKWQLRNLISIAQEVYGVHELIENEQSLASDVFDIANFVQECLNAKK
ncbi:helix-turn-helix transcriptional regulator [Bdellovibrionota bacterium FG-1]